MPYLQYVWSPRYIDAPVLRDRDADGSADGSLEERLYYTTDGIPNITALVEPDGDVVERYTYDAYGRREVRNPTTWALLDAANPTVSGYDNRIGFAGYHYDETIGLYDVRNRPYDPWLGRWLVRDYEGYIDGPGVYEYVGGNPAGYVDPEGLSKLSAAQGVGRVTRKVARRLGLIQRHHVIPRSVFRKHKDELRRIGLGPNQQRNLIDLPTRRGATDRRLSESIRNQGIHDGWTGAHRQHNARVQSEAEDILGRLSRNDITPPQAADELANLQDKLRRQLEDGRLNLASLAAPLAAGAAAAGSDASGSGPGPAFVCLSEDPMLALLRRMEDDFRSAGSEDEGSLARDLADIAVDLTPVGDLRTINEAQREMRRTGNAISEASRDNARTRIRRGQQSIENIGGNINNHTNRRMSRPGSVGSLYNDLGIIMR